MKARLGKPRPYLGAYLLALIVVLMESLRFRQNFEGTDRLGPAFLALGCYAVLVLLEYLFSSRLRWPWTIYFLLQTGLLLYIATLRPFLDVISSAFLPLFVQAFYYRPRQEAYFWGAIFSLVVGAVLISGVGMADGLAQALLVIAEAMILTTLALLVVQSQKDREHSQALVAGLQQAQRKLQEYSAQAEQLVAERERNQLARELHDSVGQMIFSIELTCESARMLLEREPEKVPVLLERMQEITGLALKRLRSIISELRPPASPLD